MEFYEKPSLEDLEHYGVKGMKWGIIRSRDERLASYTRRQLKKADKRNTKAVNKATKKYEKAKQSNEQRETSRKTKKVAKRKRKLDRAKLEKLVEERYIKNMTWEDMKSEKHAVTKQWAKAWFLDVGRTPIQSFVGPFPRYKHVKKQYRLNEGLRREAARKIYF